MRASRTTHVRLLSLLIAGAASPALAGACGGRSEGTTGPTGTSGGLGSSGTSGSSGGTSGGTSGTSGGTSGTSGTSGTVVTSGCGSPATITTVVDETQCRPQIQTQTTCGGSVCSWTVEQPCEPDGGVADDGGDGGAPEAGSQEACQALCNAAKPAGYAGGGFCYMAPQDGGTKLVVQCGGCGVGRPPRGFVARSAFAPNAVAERLAQMAQLEAASVGAFHALHADLVRHGAPAGLLRAVLAAADDEVRHARATRCEAERFGACVPAARLPAARPRSLEELAVENAEEGCVNETFGAALAAMQAERATDLRVRRMMKVIAREELGHAALSWELAGWLEEKLDAEGRARVEQARRKAVSALFDEVAREGEGCELLGVPDAATSRATLAAMRTALEIGDLSITARAA